MSPWRAGFADACMVVLPLFRPGRLDFQALVWWSYQCVAFVGIFNIV